MVTAESVENTRKLPTTCLCVPLLSFGYCVWKCCTQSPPLWGKLIPGSDRVGFRTVWQLDYSRRYNTTFADKTTYATSKAPRPILINIWYPAKASGSGTTVRQRDYLDVRSAEPSLAKFSGALAD